MLGEDTVTEWLRLWKEGDPDAMAQVMDRMYQDLKRIAAYYLAGERQESTLQPTALVHEAYLRLGSVRQYDWAGRGHFLGVVTQIMRRVLVDHARARAAAKRTPIAVETTTDPSSRLTDVLAVDEALTALAHQYPRCGEIVELRFFGDLTLAEIADVLDTSLTSVERDWRFARAWLEDRMTTP